MSSYMTQDDANRTWAHFFYEQRYVLPEGETIFDRIPDQELEILMKFGVGNTNTRTFDDPGELWKKLSHRDDQGDLGVHDILAWGETLPSTFNDDPYEGFGKEEL